jgi:sugar phosphate isomerase/epimerase
MEDFKLRDWKYSLSTAEEAPITAPILLRGNVCDNLKSAARLGYDAIEVHTRETAALNYEEICQTSIECGVKVGMIITGRLYTEGKLSLVDDDPNVTTAAVSGMLKYVDMASKLDADLVVGWVKGNVPANGSREKYIQRLAKNLKVIAAYGNKKNVKLNLEVINRYEVNIFTNCQEIVDFLETYKIDNCYVHLDTFHMNIDETNPAAAINLAGKRLGYFHIADNSRRYPGSGQIDFIKTLKALERIDYKGVLSVECFPYPSGEEAAAMAVTFMKSLRY